MGRPRGRSPRTAPSCANCGVRLKGAWCHACGQHAEGLHRSVKQVTLEWLQGLVHFDRRARSTLPDLVINPARLTTNYLAGRRAPQIPPLKMFLVVLVVLFFASTLADKARAGREGRPIFNYIGETPATGLGGPGVAFADLTPAQKREVQAHIAKVGIGLGGQQWSGGTSWLQARLNRALDAPDAFAELLNKWARRSVILMLPIGTALLCLLFWRRREVMVFDHLVFSMHSLSFQGLLLSVVELGGLIPGNPAMVLVPAGALHLFVHLRGVYRSPVIGTLVQMTVLGVGSLAAFAVFLLAATLAGLVELGGVTPP